MEQVRHSRETYMNVNFYLECVGKGTINIGDVDECSGAPKRK